MIPATALDTYVYGQEDDTDLSLIREFDDLLPLQVPATLAGLSLAAGAFIAGLGRNVGPAYDLQFETVRKYFIMAFYFFIVCISLVFVFDFLEILSLPFFMEMIDIVSTYGFFWVGLVYLLRGASKLYKSR